MNAPFRANLDRMKPYAFIALAAILLPAALQAETANDHSKQPLRFTSESLGSGLYMFRVKGGNIAVSVGSDGTFMVDDQFAPHHDRIQQELQKLSEKPLRFLVNTHWHGDHTGGNASFQKDGALIVAHENVRARMSTEQFNSVFKKTSPPSPAEALPVVTFTNQMTFHWNDQTIQMHHVKNAHTDGDTLVHFVEANVIHAGDIFFNGLYPFIDGDSGGTLDGVILAATKILNLSNDQTKIVPGHGPLANREDVSKYRQMLMDVRSKIRPMIERGLSLQQVQNSKPSAAYDETWGKSFLSPEKWVSILYKVARPIEQ